MLTGKDRYLERYGYTIEVDLPEPAEDANLWLVIPVLDEPNILECIKSLIRCDVPEEQCEILLIFNHSENAPAALKDRNKASYEKCGEWVMNHYKGPLDFVPVWAGDLPAKKAGVGTARKIGMDLALRRSRKDIVITCLDADCQVDENYLISIENHFKRDLITNAASIYFEHPLSGHLESGHYEGIAMYELHLRYFIQAQRYAGFPWAFHTVGSAMAVRASGYIQQGGMNTRRAGEDFYFLHRLIPLGKFSEINDTRVLPSPRLSSRVPFGTGKAIGDWLENEKIPSYSIRTFDILKNFFEGHELLFDGKVDELPEPLEQFLKEQKFEKALNEIRLRSTSPTVFRGHFFQWFNAFRVMKFANYYRDYGTDSTDIIENAVALLQKYDMPTEDLTNLQLLNVYRDLDRSGVYSH